MLRNPGLQLPAAGGARRPRPAVIAVAAAAAIALLALILVLPGYLQSQTSGSSLASDPVGVGRAVLEKAPGGSRLTLVLLNASGDDSALSGSLRARVQTANGSVWEVARDVTPADFARISAPSLLAGRTGYQILIPDSVWGKRPDRGTRTTVFLTVTPDAAPGFTSLAQETFP